MDDIDAIIARTEKRTRLRKAAQAAGVVRGRHYTEWVEHLNTLRARGDSDDEALELTLEIIAAAETAAHIQSNGPSPGPTIRAAVIYRRRGDREAEIAILQRWVSACPPESDPMKWKPGERLTKLLG